MAAIPYMKFYVADYMADAAHLSTVQHGAYLLLLMTYWQKGHALPDDDQKLARICRMGPREFLRHKPLLSEFFQIADGAWSHKRVDIELAHVAAKSLKSRKAGLASVESRLSGRSKNVGAVLNHTDTDTDTELPLPKGNGASPSSDKEFWDNAKAYLGPSKSSLIGKWIKQSNQATVAGFITASQLERAVNPVEFIEGCMRKRKVDHSDELPIC